MEGTGLQLHPETRIRAKECLERLLASISTPETLGHDGSLAGGAAGLALFHAHLHRMDPDRGFGERALNYLASAVESLARDPMGPGLLGGASGIALAHGQVMGILGHPGKDDEASDLDQVLEQYLARGAPGLGFDLVDGLVGLGVYGLHRAKESGRGVLLDAVVKILARRSVATPSGATWFTPPEGLPPHQRREAPDGYFNLGLAHGVPAVPALLGQAIALGAGGDSELRLYGQAVAWILAQRNPEPAAANLGPWVPKGEDEPRRRVRHQEPMRVAWCYGDLGAGVALLRGACALGDHETREAGLAFCRKAARCQIPESGMADASLCHGAAGNAHLFHRLHRCTGEPIFALAAEAHLLQALEWEDRDGPNPGFRFWLPRHEEDPEPWRSDPGMLNGTAGVGLVLMAFLDGLEPTWDRCLLADLPGWK